MSVKTFIREFQKSTEPNPLNNRESIWEETVCFELRPFSGNIRLSNIRALTPGNGDGTEALRWLCALADKHGVTITGTVEPTWSAPLNKTALKAWYCRHGFKVVYHDDIEYEPKT